VWLLWKDGQREVHSTGKLDGIYGEGMKQYIMKFKKE